MLITGTRGRDTRHGTADHDQLVGLDGEDWLFGEGGDDEFMGGRGADLLNGGPGFDTARYDDSPVGVFVSLLDGRGFNGTAAGDTLFDIESVVGSLHNDILIGNNEANLLQGLDGADSLFGGGGDDHLIGDRGNDLLVGGAGGDDLDGGEGIDTADYSDSPEGVSVALGRDGELGHGSHGFAEGDTLAGIENLVGSLHDDFLLGNNQANRIEGLAGSDVIYGLRGADRLFGNRGDDILVGGAGADHLDGGLGNNDTAAYVDSEVGVQVNLELGRGYSGTALGDELIGIENLMGSNHDDVMVGDARANVIEGGRGADQLVGGGGNDHLFGGLAPRPTGDFVAIPDDAVDRPRLSDGDDILIGGRGNDTLTGGTGADRMTGGSDADTFVFNFTYETDAYERLNMDYILDFSQAQHDKIDVHGIDANEGLDGNQDFTTFIGTAEFSATPTVPGSATPGQIRYFTIGGDTYIVLNTDTDPDNDAAIRVAGERTPDASWFNM
jgi:Ca2+-binding RTX toxin-like protein